MIFLSFFNNLDGVQRIASGNARRSLEIGEHVSNICLFVLKLFHLRNFQRRNPAPSLKSKNCSFFSFLNCLWNHDLIFSSPQFLQKQHRSLTKNLKSWSQRMSEEKTEDFDILLSIVLTRSTDDKAKPVWERHCKQSFSRNLKIDYLDGCHWQSFVKVQHKLYILKTEWEKPHSKSNL